MEAEGISIVLRNVSISLFAYPNSYLSSLAEMSRVGTDHSFEMSQLRTDSSTNSNSANNLFKSALGNTEGPQQEVDPLAHAKFTLIFPIPPEDPLGSAERHVLIAEESMSLDFKPA